MDRELHAKERADLRQLDRDRKPNAELQIDKYRQVIPLAPTAATKGLVNPSKK